MKTARLLQVSCYDTQEGRRCQDAYLGPRMLFLVGSDDAILARWGWAAMRWTLQKYCGHS